MISQLSNFIYLQFLTFTLKILFIIFRHFRSDIIFPNLFSVHTKFVKRNEKQIIFTEHQIYETTLCILSTINRITQSVDKWYEY